MTSNSIDSPKDVHFNLDCVSAKNKNIENDIEKWYTIDKDMFLAKLTYLLTGLEISSTSPYQTMFLISIGLNLKQAGYVFSMSYAGLMIGSIFWGVLADKTRAYRVLLFILYIAYAVFYLLGPLVSLNIGEKEKNQCPLVINEANIKSNSTSKTFNDEYNDISSIKLTYVLATLAFFGTSFCGSIYSYIDAGVIEKIKMSSKPIDFGRQYMFVEIGYAFGALISAEVMDIFPTVQISCFFAVFCVGVIFLLASCVSSQYLFKGIKIQSQNEPKSGSYKKDLFKTFTNIEVNLFLITTFFNGMLYCVYLNYLFVFLNEIHSTNLLIGLTVAFGSLSGLVVDFFSEIIIRFLKGTFNTMILCTFLWSVRFLMFYFLKNPWLIIPLQLTLHGLCLSLFYCVKSIHLKLISPNSIHTTMFGTFQCLHSGIAPIVGSLIGGELYYRYGARKTFLFVCLIALSWTVCLCIYVVGKNLSQKNVRELSKSVIIAECSIEVSDLTTKL